MSKKKLYNLYFIHSIVVIFTTYNNIMADVKLMYQILNELMTKVKFSKLKK